MVMSDHSYTASQLADLPASELKALAEDEFLEQFNDYLKQYEAEIKSWLESGGAEEQSWSAQKKP